MNAGDPVKVDILVGGLWHATDLATGLAENGCDVRLVSSAPVPAGPYDRFHIPVWPFQRLANRLSYRPPDVMRAIGLLLCAGLRKDSRVIAWSSFALACLERGRPAVVVRGSHHIQRQRDILLEANVTTGVALPLPPEAAVALERREYGLAAAVTVPTTAIARDPYWREDGARLQVSPYGFPPLPRLNTDGGLSRSLVFVGSVGLRKGVDRLAAAFPNQNSTIRDLHLVGRQSPELKRVGPLPAWWTFHGQVPSARVRTIVVSCSMLGLLSREEGMARVGLEALASGTPILVSQETGLAEWLVDGGGVVVDPTDPESVRSGAEDLLANWSEHSLQARSVASSWTWKQHASRVLSCLSP